MYPYTITLLEDLPTGHLGFTQTFCEGAVQWEQFENGWRAFRRDDPEYFFFTRDLSVPTTGELDSAYKTYLNRYVKP